MTLDQSQSKEITVVFLKTKPKIAWINYKKLIAWNIWKLLEKILKEEDQEFSNKKAM